MIDDEPLDLAAVVAQLQHENERLRARVVQLRYSASPFDFMPTERVRAFLRDPIKVYIATMLIVMVVVPLLRALIAQFAWRAFRHRSRRHEE